MIRLMLLLVCTVIGVAAALKSHVVLVLMAGYFAVRMISVLYGAPSTWGVVGERADPTVVGPLCVVVHPLAHSADLGVVAMNWWLGFCYLVSGGLMVYLMVEQARERLRKADQSPTWTEDELCRQVGWFGCPQCAPEDYPAHFETLLEGE